MLELGALGMGNFSTRWHLNWRCETPVLWPPHVTSWLIGKDSDAGRDWGHWFFSTPAPWVPTQSHTLYSLLMTQEWAGTGSPGRLPFCESGERTVFSQLHSPHPCSSLCSFPELLSPGLYCGPPWPCQSCLGCASCAPQGGLTQDETKPVAVLINSESH